MANDALTVGESRRIVQEILRALGVSKPQGINHPLPDDDNPITIESFRNVMREGLEKIFVATSQEGPEPEKKSKAQIELERVRQQPEQILLDVVNGVTEVIWQLKALAALVGNAEGLSCFAKANDPEGLASALHAIFEMLLDKQQTILYKAWKKCEGGESNG